MHIKNLEELLNMAKEISDKGCIYIWGTGVFGDLLGKAFNKENVKWSGYYDNFSADKIKGLNGMPVYGKDKVDISENAFYILSMWRYETVYNQLVNQKIAPDHIVFFENANFFNDLKGETKELRGAQKQIRTFYKKHDGDKCFVIGNGPSLQLQDLNRIYEKGIASFGSNMIFNCYAKTKWRPDYHFFADPAHIRKVCIDGNLDYLSQNCKYLFSRNDGEMEKYISQIANLVIYKAVFSASKDKIEFSSDCSQKIYMGNSATYTILQMAVYMGFKEIYLLGMDHVFTETRQSDGSIKINKNVKNHAEILGNYAVSGVADMDAVTSAYQSAKEYADAHGIKIYNATRGGKLEVFERVDFDSLFLGERET